MSVALSAHAVLDALPNHSDPEWLADRRAEAIARLESSGFPSKSETWKGTDVAAFISQTKPATAATVSQEDVKPFLFDGVQHLAVLVDGTFQPGLSRLDGLPHDVHVESLSSALERPSPVLSEHLGQTGPLGDPFADWNMAAWTDGLFITTAANVTLDSPIHVLHLRSTQAGTVCFPRVLVHARDGTDLTVFEHFAGLEDAATTTVATTELVAHNGATLRYERIQQEWTQAQHMHALVARADRDATIAMTDAGLGAARSRLSVEGHLAGSGSHLSLDGFFLVGGTRRTDVWTRFDHAVPNTSSAERVKGVLGDSARAAFTGNVLVRPDAQQTSAEQQNRNLLLSRKALVDTQPQLEIHADDVQCSHGSTVGQLDDEALFFLQSRGIGLDAARLLLTKAFLGEIVGTMHPLLRDGINRRIEAWFERHPQTLEVTP